MRILEWIVLIILLIGLLSCIFFWLKNNRTLLMQYVIMDAIHDYIENAIRNHCWVVLVDYSDMETYDQTFCRWWDWGYTRILPKDKLALISSYIDVERSKERMKMGY